MPTGTIRITVTTKRTKRNRLFVFSRICLSISAIAGLILGVYFAAISWRLQRLETQLEALVESVAASPADWRDLAAESAALTRWAQLDANAFSFAGRVYLFGGARMAETPREQIAATREAKRFLLRELRLRPQTASTWLNLSRAEYMLAPLGSAWREALLRAVSLNLRGKTVQLDLLEFRKIIERRTDLALQQRLDVELKQSLRDFPQETIVKASQLARREWVCDMPDLDPQLAELCSK